ncbi:CD225/dispanin family protein [Luteirhabdus pelagi]|uniref:CD225/dispanin family protein n=1 Tax=Luteirhabdus pelagi TaxID=2792783 RepID=UPI00193A8C87|nr:CD225/dispanin family protein [Luteirhabdus pelagi]MCT8339485.1 CD225/dispanin family protein [Thermobacterium salinum]
MENLSNQPPKPDNHLVWAILSTVLCCLPLGIVSIIKSTKVNEHYAAGHYDEAQKASEEAKKWAIWSAVAAIAVWVIYFILIGIGVAGGIMSGGY